MKSKAIIVLILLGVLGGCITGKEFSNEYEIKDGGINMDDYPPVTALHNGELK